MTNAKHTKKALLASCLSMLLCFAMLIGTTFAWFTDSASTGVNRIQSGKLDVMLQMSEDGGTTWNDAEGKTLGFKVAENGAAAVDESGNILWEPGAEFEIPQLKIVNNGNLALKFKLLVNGVIGDVDLAKVIDVYVSVDGVAKENVGTLRDMMSDPDGAAYGNLDAGAETKAYAISFKMQETAGNTYQEKSIENISFTVVATQYTKESDSFGDQYDAGAKYDEASAITFENGNIDAEGNQLFTTEGVGTVTQDGSDLIIESTYRFGPYTSLAKYIPVFPTKGYTVSACIYIDPEKVDKGFNLDYSFKVNDPDPAANNTNEQFISIYRNANSDVVFSVNQMWDDGMPVLTKAGYYTINWAFTDDNGYIRKTISIEDDTNTEFFSTTGMMELEGSSHAPLKTSWFIKGGSFMTLFPNTDNVRLKSITVENLW